MTSEQIQEAVDLLSDQMQGLGMGSIHVSADHISHSPPSVYLRWSDDGKAKSEFADGENIIEALQSARDIINKMPSKSDRDKEDFARLLGSAIEKGRAIGMPVEFLNPLQESMKKLSENALTYEGAD